MLGSTLGTVVFATLILFVIFRRIRGIYRPRRIRTRLLVLRAALFAVIAFLVAAVPGTPTVPLLVALIGGATLAAYALWLTTFEHTEKGTIYRPNTYVGMIVFSLFLGRLAYRITALAALPDGGTFGSVFANRHQGPSVTLVILFVLVGYYVCYNTGVVIRSRTLRAA